ncbi:hypothetical protein [Mobiluncus curtisii]|uniref:Uncharacterized protein n=1 Tax=Mobiluncus curtisii ATCC 51333 TaxID=887326 RepID=E6LZ14_9ACTO|nr:hypothetical protein [Mobiluncus curtisii]EFU79870.1 hypothetical protein HMPREF0388_1101 [Mobiluncus curtisii ATCC 51333]
MSIPAVGPSFPLGNAGVANAANAANAAPQNASTAAQNAQAAVNNAAANMGAAAQQNLSATGLPVPQNSAVIANVTAGLASAQNNSAAFSGKPNTTPAQSNASPATQLLPNTGTSSANLDSALQNSRSAWQNAAGQAAGQRPATNPNSLARMLQSFSQSTVSPGTVQTSLGRAQIIPPGQGANLYAAVQSGGTTTAANAASGTGTANPGTSAASTSAQSAPPALANSAATATSGSAAVPQTAAGAATLRAEGAQTQAAPAPANPAGTSASAPGGPAVPAALPEAAVRQVNAAQASAQQAVTQAAASDGGEKTAVARPQSQARNAAILPDANPAPALPAPLMPQDPAPKAGQLGASVAGVSEDPVYMSQVAAASGFGAKLQQTLNLNLGIANLTAGNLISLCGVLVITLVVMRVFVDGVVAEEIVALSFATIIGIMLLIGPRLMRENPRDKNAPPPPRKR